MALIKDILNHWGKQAGPNPQRSDLWQVDLTALIKGLNGVTGSNTLPQIPRYFSASISLPELKIKPEPIRRDSRSYNMPSWDEPLDSIRMTFVVDDGGSQSGIGAQGSQSTIYTILDVWRAVVRAGRGELTSEQSIVLNANYRIDYAFPIYVYFLRGNTNQQTSTSYSGPVTGQGSSYGQTFEGSGAISEEAATQRQIQASGGYQNLSTLQLAATLRLDNAWLGGFKMGELNYEQAKVLTIEATVYADNIYQVRTTLAMTPAAATAPSGGLPTGTYVEPETGFLYTDSPPSTGHGAN